MQEPEARVIRKNRKDIGKVSGLLKTKERAF